MFDRAAIFLVIAFISSKFHLLSSYSQHDDAASLLQSAFETSGVAFSEQKSPQANRPTKNSFFSKYGWPFRFSFRPFSKEANRVSFIASRGGQSLQKPLKMEYDGSVDYQQMMNLYRTPRLNFPALTGVRASDLILSSPIQPQITDAVTPITNYEEMNHQQMLRDQIYQEPNVVQSVPMENDPKLAKMRSIRYDYGGFKPIGPGTRSPMIFTSYSDDSYIPLVNQTQYSVTSPADAYPRIMANSTDDDVFSATFDEVSTPRDGKSLEMSVESSKNAETFITSAMFHPEKVEPDNKIILPVNPSDLLRLVSEETRSKGSRAKCTNRDLGWCDMGEQYPTNFVEAIIGQCQKSVDQMYVEVPTNLVDFKGYLPFNSSSILSENHNQDGNTEEAACPDCPTTPSSNSSTRAPGKSRRRGKSMCDIERRFIKPIIAQDITGSWYLIVQTSLYNQQVPVEICSKPGLPCNKNSKCGHKTRCIQKFATQLLISINMDKEKECPSMKLYRFPSGCVCDFNYHG